MIFLAIITVKMFFDPDRSVTRDAIIVVLIVITCKAKWLIELAVDENKFKCLHVYISSYLRHVLHSFFHSMFSLGFIHLVLIIRGVHFCAVTYGC